MRCLTLVVTAFVSCFSLGQTQNEQLAKVPAVWEEPVHRLTEREYEATLQHWAKKYEGLLAVERIGVTKEGQRIWLVKVTDSQVPDDNKQHCLVTALHGGPERSGTTTALHLIEWLVSDDPVAVTTRKRQQVWLIPIINPYAYFQTDRFGNSLKIDPYTGGGANNWDLKTMTFKPGDQSPEIQAFLRTVDRFQPDAHLDMHGTGLQEYPDNLLRSRQRYQGQTMIEITGSAYSNFSLRPWDWKVTEAMIRAGEQAGYPSDRFEADAQELFAGASTNPVGFQFWRGRPQFYTAQYGYTKYHTLVAANEIGWEKSGLARAIGWLQIGNQSWEDEPYEGYPVDRIDSFIGHYVTAWGESAAQRRKSRVHLWQRQGRWNHGVLYPQTDGRVLFTLAASDKAKAVLSPDPAQFVSNLKQLDIVDAQAIERFIKAGPEIKLAVEQGNRSLAEDWDNLEHGLGIRLRLPYRSPEIVDLRLNGHLISKGTGEGFQSWEANGWRHVQISIPPNKAQACDGLFVASCAYVPPVKRRIGWTPPSEVLESLKIKANTQ